MAVDKLVDSTQLDADLTSVANAIRTKGGTSADLAFPSGFVSAVEAIPTGGGDDYEDFTAGNIQAIVSHGTEWIQTDYYGTLTDLISIKLADSSKETYEGYWAISGTGNVTNTVQRYSNGNNLTLNYNSTAVNGLSIEGYSTGDPVIVVHDAIWLQPITVTLPLVIGRSYYKGALESTISAFTFYGLNILDSDFKFVKRFMPWLDNGEACVKEVISGAIYRNSGSGAYDYIDKEGVLHSA